MLSPTTGFLSASIMVVHSSIAQLPVVYAYYYQLTTVCFGTIPTRRRISQFTKARHAFPAFCAYLDQMWSDSNNGHSVWRMFTAELPFSSMSDIVPAECEQEVHDLRTFPLSNLSRFLLHTVETMYRASTMEHSRENLWEAIQQYGWCPGHTTGAPPAQQRGF
jgi:hypothetical protein